MSAREIWSFKDGKRVWVIKQGPFRFLVRCASCNRGWEWDNPADIKICTHCGSTKLERGIGRLWTARRECWRWWKPWTWGRTTSMSIVRPKSGKAMIRAWDA